MKNLKLSMQLSISFGAILVLLLITSVITYNGLSNTHGGLSDYRNLAKDTNLTGRVQANILMMRLSVLAYLNDHSEAKIEEYDSRKEKMNKFLLEAKDEIKEPTRANLISEVMSEIGGYDDGFSNVVSLYAKREGIVAGSLDPAGLAMRKATTDIIKSAHRDGDADAAYYGSQVQEHLLLGRLFVTKYLVTNESADASRAIDELENKMIRGLEELDIQIENPQRRELLEKIKKYHQQYLLAFKDIQKIILNRNEIITNTLNRIGPVIADKIEQVKLSVKKDQDTLGPVVQSDAENTKTLVGVISFIALIAGILIAVVMAKVIKEPIGGEPTEIAEIANRISKGDLTETIELTASDSGIYRSVAEMSQRLRELISSILNNSISLANASNSSSEIALENTETVQQQKQMVDSVVVAVEEMSISIQEVAKNAVDSANKAEVATSEVLKGKEIVEMTTKAINELSDTLTVSMSVIGELDTQSNEIGSFIDVIQGISEQTNLLALNAAIEAARAGEQGRGFAVVADEVRALAQRTQDSTAEIQSIISNLQQGTAKTVLAMKQSTLHVESAVKQAVNTDLALTTIHEVITEISGMNMQVATAVEEQASVSSEIACNMSTISKNLDDIKESANKNQLASVDIKNTAVELNNLATNFKV